MQESGKWWGEFHFSENAMKSWNIADRKIAIKRDQLEWVVWDIKTQTEIIVPLIVKDESDSSIFEGKDYSRYLLDDSVSSLEIEPSLADRAMIVRPSVPLSIMPGQSIKLHVSTPLWFTILLPNKKIPIFDVPFWRPSDTWFGPNTIQGDMCYSKYTDAKLNIEKLEKSVNRAITVISIKNDDEKVLKVERINIPVPSLKLYSDEKNRFWTEQLNIIQTVERGQPVSEIKISNPTASNELNLVASARTHSNKSSLLSSIKNLVG